MFKVTIVVLIVQILTYLHCGNSSLIRSRSSSNSVNLDDTSAKQQQLQQYDSNWKEIFIQAVETNSKSHSPRKRHFARKLVKDLEGTLKSNNPFHYFRLGNRSVRGYVGEPGTEEREENENFFQRKWNDLRELLHRFKNWCKSWFRSEPAEELEPSDDRNHEHGSPKSHPPTDSKKSEHLGQNSDHHGEIKHPDFTSIGEHKRAEEPKKVVPTDHHGRSEELKPRVIKAASAEASKSNHPPEAPKTPLPHDLTKPKDQFQMPRTTTADVSSSSKSDSAIRMKEKIRQLYPDNKGGSIYYQVGDRIRIDKTDLSSLIFPSEKFADPDSGVLTANIIDAYLFALSQDYKQFSYLDTESVYYMRRDDVAEKAIEQFLVGKRPKPGQTYYAIPLMQRKGHCVLVIIRFDKKQYSILDPKPQHLEAKIAQDIKLKTGKFLQVVTSDQFEEVPLSIMSERSFAEHTSDVFVCWLAKRFASDELMRGDLFEFDKFRVEMFDRITSAMVEKTNGEVEHSCQSTTDPKHQHPNGQNEGVVPTSPEQKHGVQMTPGFFMTARNSGRY